ncbi:uncharacterized protein LOC131605963 [Vicia villosa]|uniref:uncharacterized protein LOC131605963 n=1 Tax=Vicia villosa TaxID=3911 RepID=UPI00273C266C|nr:uncharacterized protein LOC131605963 [Vicia villosa]
MLRMFYIWDVGGALEIVVISRSYMSLGLEVARISALEVVAKEIFNIPLIEEVVEDKLVWDEEKNGDYSVRTGYKLWRNSRYFQPNCRVGGNWDSLWNIMVLPRVKHLLWRICIGCLTTIVDHHLQTFSDVKSIILDICSREDKKDAGRFAVVLESLWKNHNNIVWNNNREDISRIGTQAYYNWFDWFDAREIHVPNIVPQLPLVCIPPSEGWLKCNVDADFNSHYQTTNRGWCLRDNMGRFIIAGVAWDKGIMSPLEV